MALNPITYTEKIVSNFLRYQFTTYAFAGKDLHRQMRDLLSLEQTTEENWAEYEHHDHNLFGEAGFAQLQAEPKGHRPPPAHRADRPTCSGSRLWWSCWEPLKKTWGGRRFR